MDWGILFFWLMCMPILSFFFKQGYARWYMRQVEKDPHDYSVIIENRQVYTTLERGFQDDWDNQFMTLLTKGWETKTHAYIRDDDVPDWQQLLYKVPAGGCICWYQGRRIYSHVVLGHTLFAHTRISGCEIHGDQAKREREKLDLMYTRDMMRKVEQMFGNKKDHDPYWG